MNTMKSKHLLILLLSLFVFCFSSTVFANKAQDEAIDYLKQAVENTANAKNLTYKINLSMTSPLADGDIIVDGKYSELMNTSGNMNISFNSWIDTIKFEATTQFYTEIADNNLAYKEMSELERVSPTKIDRVRDGISHKDASDVIIHLIGEMVNLGPEECLASPEEKVNNEIIDAYQQLATYRSQKYSSVSRGYTSDYL